MKRIRLVICLAAGLWGCQALAQGVSVEAGGGGSLSDGFLVGARSFYFSDQSTLGSDTLTDGSAVLTRFDMQYNFDGWFSGIGAFYESDTYGGIQTDTILGAVIELYIGNLFAKMLVGSIEQQFQERSYSVRNGSFTAYEFGIRASLIGQWAFYEIALHQRTKSIEREDDRDMASPYSDTQAFPVLGIGVSL